MIKNIAKSSLLSYGEASGILESFLLQIKSTAKLRPVKLSSFGSFSYKKTPKRLGRNPKTKVSYIIPVLNKLNFKPSTKIKEKLN
jgi:nucleoid DNA-binding protein